jgi:hypothetical protein
MPCPQAYNARFGGLVEAYRRIGYEPARGGLSFVDCFKKLVPKRRQFTQMVLGRFKEMGLPVIQDSRTKLVYLNDNMTVRFLVARCKPLESSHGWLFRLHSRVKPDELVIARLAPGNETFKDYFCIPQRALGHSKQITIVPDGSDFDKYRHDGLTFLKKIARRSKAKVSAAKE